MAENMVLTYLHFRILEIPLTCCLIGTHPGPRGMIFGWQPGWWNQFDSQLTYQPRYQPTQDHQACDTVLYPGNHKKKLKLFSGFHQQLDPTEKLGGNNIQGSQRGSRDVYWIRFSECFQTNMDDSEKLASQQISSLAIQRSTRWGHGEKNM